MVTATSSGRSPARSRIIQTTTRLNLRFYRNRQGSTGSCGICNTLRQLLSRATQDNLEGQFDLLLRIRDLLSETNETIIALRNVRSQIEQWQKRLGDDQANSIRTQADELVEALNEIELALIQPEAESSLQYPEGLNAKLAKLTAFIDMDDARPTKQAGEQFENLSEQISGHLARYRKLVREDVTPLNEQIRDSGLPLIDTVQ